MKVTRGNKTDSASAARGSGRASPSSGVAFKPDVSAGVATETGGASAAAVAPASTLAALIDLQADGRGRMAMLTNACRILSLLENIQSGLLSGRLHVSDLETLANAATAKIDNVDQELAGVYDEIALRARVELAKLGR